MQRMAFPCLLKGAVFLEPVDMGMFAVGGRSLGCICAASRDGISISFESLYL